MPHVNRYPFWKFPEKMPAEMLCIENAFTDRADCLSVKDPQIEIQRASASINASAYLFVEAQVNISFEPFVETAVSIRWYWYNVTTDVHLPLLSNRLMFLLPWN